MRRLVFVFLFVSFISTASAEDSSQPNVSESTDIAPISKVDSSDYSENYAFDDPAQRKTFLELTEVLRCPMCQNQNIADSDAMIAHDMRRKVYQLMQDGQSKTDVIDFMKQRYGDFVHYQPPVNTATIWLWLLPVLFAFIMGAMFIMRKKPILPDDKQAKLAKADRLLEENE